MEPSGDSDVNTLALAIDQRSAQILWNWEKCFSRAAAA